MKCKQIMTFSVNGEAVERTSEITVTLEADEARHLESGVVNLYPGIEYQTIDGFGGAMTETSAYLLSKMDADTRKKALECYFGEGGNNVRFVRVHLDSCDYSLEEYQAVEDPMADPEFKTFSLKRDQMYILPVLKEALAMSTQPLSVLLSPWSPPACWKTPPAKPKNDAGVYGMMGTKPPSYDEPSRCNGGSLKPEFYASWAKYMIKFVKAYMDEGIPVTMLSIQNEAIAATNWDSCVWTSEQEKTFLRDFLYPELKSAGLVGKVGLFIWDHNKERVLERAIEIIDAETRDMIEGVAFHWYSGDHFEAVKMLSEVFPEKTLLMSECCEFNTSGGGFMAMMMGPRKTLGTIEYGEAAHYAHDIIGNLNAGMQRWIDWNFIVDKNGGPRHVPGGFIAGMIANEDGTFRAKLTYHFIGHFARYIKPGAKRIGFSRFSDDFAMTAAKNPDGQVVAVFLNKKAEDSLFAIRINGKVIRVQLPSQTISTVLIDQ